MTKIYVHPNFLPSTLQLQYPITINTVLICYSQDSYSMIISAICQGENCVLENCKTLTLFLSVPRTVFAG